MLLLFAAMLVLLATAGCVRRRLLVRSDPPGAMVYVDDYQVGTTPVAVDFTYYGTRKIKLVKDGYQTLTVYQEVPAPWYQWPGIDFVSENLVPQTMYDRRVLHYQLTPQAVVPTDQLLDRAEQLRRGTFPSPGTPAGQPFSGASLPPPPGSGASSSGGHPSASQPSGIPSSAWGNPVPRQPLNEPRR